MNILKSISILAFTLTTALSCAQLANGKKIKGNGDVTTIKRSTNSYNAINAAGSMDFNLIEGKEGNITIKADANLIDYILTEVKNDKLYVKLKDGVSLKPTETIVITIPYESLESVSLAGSGSIYTNNTIEADIFKVSIAGSGDINLNITAKSIETSIAGSGDIALNGTATDINIKITGSGDFNGKTLESTNVSAKITGSGSATVICNGILDAKITGSGDVIYSGKPTHKDTKILGSGKVTN